MMPSYATPPTPQTGLALNAARGWFSVLIPIARTNLITNPSFELDTTGWTAAGGASIARVTTQQAVGIASCQITMSGANDGVRHAGLAMVAGELRAVSCMFRGTAGRRYRCQIEDGGGGTTSRVLITATGRWQELRWYCSTQTTATYYFFVGALAAGADVVYLDAVQVEQIQPGETGSTYIDGDQLGLIAQPALPAYGWNGSPHASTSYRSAQTRAGGMIMNFDLAQLVLTAVIGLGLAPVAHVVSPYAQLDGAAYDRTRLTERAFSLVGRIDAANDGARSRALALLEDWLSRDRIATQQPLRLRYERFDGFTPTSEIAQIDALYTAGLEGAIDSRSGAAVPLQFALFAPYVTAVREEGGPLAVQQTIANANRVLMRTAGGQWQALGVGITGNNINAIAIGPDGSVYVGGDFTNAGTSGADYLARWDGSTWAVVGSATALNGAVRALAFDSAGKLYIGGDFMNAGGNANADFVATWDGSSWGALGTGMNNTVQALHVAPDGSVYAGGAFTLAGGVANTVRVAKWNGSAWLALSTGANNIVYALATGADGRVYAGGVFTVIGGVSTNAIAAWTGAAWTTVGSSASSDPFTATKAVYALLALRDGRLLAGGDFTGTGISRIAAWNGSTWAGLGNGVAGPSTAVTALAQRADGAILVGGTFGALAGTNPPPILPELALWNGSTFVALEVDIPGTAGSNAVNAITVAPSGAIYLGFDAAGSALAGQLTTIVNSGQGRAYPIVTLFGGPSGTYPVYALANLTTGRTIYLNLSLNARETVVINFDPLRLSAVSDFRGDVLSTIVLGSQEADFFVQPGPNVFSLMAFDPSASATIRWRPTFQSLNQLAFR